MWRDGAGVYLSHLITAVGFTPDFSASSIWLSPASCLAFLSKEPNVSA